MTHTREPWIVNEDLSIGTPASDAHPGRSNLRLFETVSSLDLAKRSPYSTAIPAGVIESDEANARRAVVCVNACAGIDHAALESGLVGEILKAYFESLKKTEA